MMLGGQLIPYLPSDRKSASFDPDISVRILGSVQRPTLFERRADPA
jgi:hypothetical protein